MRPSAILACAIGLGTALGCYTGTPVDMTGSPTGSVEPTEPGSSGDAGTAADSVAATGLPCDVASVLAECTSCHGETLRNGAKVKLVTYEDLAGPSADDPGTSVAALAVARMKNAKRPMPPTGALTADRIAVMETWVAAALPKGTCGASKDAGRAPDVGAPDAPVPTVCTSGTYAVTPATPGTPLMHPGKACIACHSTNGGPNFTLAGTVYPTLHEPSECNGVNGLGSVSVVIVDAAGISHKMPVNEAGNFIRVTGIPMPYRASVMRGTSVREMKTPQTDGDCNGCHTEQGNIAPGRIMAP